MGQGVSCSRSSYEHEFFTAVQSGDLELVELALRRDPEMVFQTTIYDRLSALHIAAANGRVEVCRLLSSLFFSAFFWFFFLEGFDSLFFFVFFRLFV